MSKKIIIIILIILVFILPAIVTAESYKNEFKRVETIANNEVNLPTWETGNSWTYYCHLSSEDSDITYDNLLITVTSVSSSEYITSIQGPVSGETIYYLGDTEVTIRFNDASLNGEVTFQKSTLGVKSGLIELTGTATISGIPTSFDLDLDMRIDPSFYPVKFPLDVGNNWQIPKSDITGKLDLKASILQLDDIFFGEAIGQYSVQCSDFIEDYNVGGNKFDCYKIVSEDGGLSEIYYSDAQKNIVKAIGPEVELTLKTAGAPNTPNRPSGPTSGSSGTSYNYKTSTTDPEGNDVYYLFDWGDGSDSGWKGPYSSGEEISLSNSWSRSGSYNIKVKAKDINDIQSGWSDSLRISIPRSRSLFKQYLINLLEKIFEPFYSRLKQF